MTERPQGAGSFAEINGTTLYYEVTGTGHPLVLIHAGIADSRMWDDQWNVFAEQFRVIRYDIRGCGRSPAPPVEFSLRDDLLGFLQLLGVSKTYLVGGSMGGGIAIDFTLEHPEMVAALIPVCAGVSGRKPSDALIAKWGEVDAAFEASGIAAANEIELQMWVDGPRRTAEQVDPMVRERVGVMNANNFAMMSEEARPLPLDPPALDRLGEIRVPTLVIVGSLDQPDTLESGELLTAGIPGAAKVEIARTAHMPSMERPEEFNRVVLNFLRNL